MPPAFDAAFRDRLHELFAWRRDVRRFRPDPVPAGTVERLLETACLSPSVGLSQPWRFAIVDDPGRRDAVRTDFRACNAAALAAHRAAGADDLAARYARLKLAGLDEAPCHVAVFADETAPHGHGLGRMTMPETVAYSAVAAICTLWLAARAEGIGLGWVSILDPARIAAILEVPAQWRFVAYLCLGYPLAEDDTPELERAGWERRQSPAAAVLRR